MYCDVGGIWWSLIGVGECLGNIGGFGECFRRCLGFRQMKMFQNGLKKIPFKFSAATVRTSGPIPPVVRSTTETSYCLPCFALFHFAFVFALKFNFNQKKYFFAKCFKSNINNIF